MPKEVMMRSLTALATVPVIFIGLLTSTDIASAKKKYPNIGGCTHAQYESAQAQACLNDTTSAHHVECSGGTMSCCNDAEDTNGLPEGFCIDIASKVGTPNRTDTVKPKAVSP
jgi:hypothetical protein